MAKTNNFQCHLCDKSFGTHLFLKLHQDKKHVQHLEMCVFCGLQLKYKSNLRRHILTVHHQTRKYSCGFCTKTFNRKDNFQRHLVRHSITEKFQCKICGLSYSRKDNLMVHNRKFH